MKLEVGMYVRTYDGINKVTKINEHRGTLYYEFEKPFEVEFLGEDIKKSSFNLIDLIEVGDYVNGYLVVGSGSQMVNDEEKRIIYTNEQEYWCGGWANKRFDYTNRNRIQSILTHELYEANCYKVGE